MAQQQGKLMPAIWGGVLIGAISGIPVLNFINCACCAGVIAGGVLAVYLFRQEYPKDRPISMSDGVALGLLAGVFGAIIGSILDALFGAATFDFLQKMSEYIQDPDVRDALSKLDRANMARGFFFLGFLLELVTDCIFGLIGGAIGVSLFGKAKPGEQIVE